ncbi:bacterial transcriptional activator domain-containing protein [Desulfobacula sp.]|uniref:bacterial transcriptional activator domain-containing protein n=1 Tax=Desulfobacula sp. TaxID=2593537 RepID=UPI00261CC1C6|nr:bacterial transcriptional activator domain-containing protein [Desulfobacula sp.]
MEHRVTLAPHYCWIDTWAFEQVYHQVDRLLKIKSDDARSNETIRLAQRALDLYQGHFLHDESWAGCFISQREKFKRRFLDLVWRLGQHWEARGQWNKAIACYQGGLDKDELAETLYCRLMVCHGKLGQHTEAARAYHRCKKMMALYLDRAPSQQVKTVYGTICSK